MFNHNSVYLDPFNQCNLTSKRHGMFNHNSLDVDPFNQCNIISKRQGMYNHNSVNLEPFNQCSIITKQHGMFKGILFVIYGILSEFTDKGQFQYLTNLKGPQEGTYLYTTQFLSLR